MTKPIGYQHQADYLAAGLTDAQSIDARNRGLDPGQALIERNNADVVSGLFPNSSGNAGGAFVGHVGGGVSPLSGVSFREIISATMKLVIWCFVGLLVLIALLFAIPATRSPMLVGLGYVASPYERLSKPEKRAIYEQLDPSGKSGLTVDQVYARLPKNPDYNAMNKSQRIVIATGWQQLVGGEMKQWRQTDKQKTVLRQAFNGYLGGLAVKTNDPRVARDLAGLRLSQSGRFDNQAKTDARAALDLAKPGSNSTNAAEFRANAVFRHAWAPR